MQSSKIFSNTEKEINSIKKKGKMVYKFRSHGDKNLNNRLCLVIQEMVVLVQNTLQILIYSY